MSDLDNKLRDIFLSKKYLQASVDPTIYYEIKQAFLEAGYINTKAVAFQGLTVGNLMTGQEWYDRFDKELPAIGGYNTDMRYKILEAAQRAAGIKEDA